MTHCAQVRTTGLEEVKKQDKGNIRIHPTASKTKDVLAYFLLACLCTEMYIHVIPSLQAFLH